MEGWVLDHVRLDFLKLLYRDPVLLLDGLRHFGARLCLELRGLFSCRDVLQRRPVAYFDIRHPKVGFNERVELCLVDRRCVGCVLSQTLCCIRMFFGRLRSGRA